MNQPLLQFKSHIDGKNADVRVYVDRIEWSKEGLLGTGGKAALGVMTGGVSLLKTGIKGKQQGSEVIPVKSISSVTTRKDGLRFTKVQVICSGNTIDFRVGHGDAQAVKDLVTALVLGNHPAQQAQSADPAPVATQPAVEPDVMQQLEQLGKLKEAGVLTDAEFESKKAVLLERL